MAFFSIPTFASAKRDLPAGLVVFLVALPLCLGIALASGAPAFSGIIAGVIGGLIISFFSGSELSVSGPAAGLAVIVATAIGKFGAFETFLMAVMLSGILQMLISFLRAGSLGNYIPHGVIKGMLAAIGITIIMKQIPHALGYDKGFTDEEQAFAGADWVHIFTDPFHAVQAFHPGAVTIALCSLAILVLWELKAMKRQKWTGIVPAALICVILGITLNAVFGSVAPGMQLLGSNDHLVNLPVADSLMGFFGQFTMPDFSSITNPLVWQTALTITAIGSVETLLSIEASDKMDPEKRISNSDRELLAQGIGNTISGFIGGLPITSVIVRSSANIYAGGRTRLSSMVHGLLLLLSVLLIPALLNMIPLACLAAILLVVGYKLSSIKLIRTTYREGWSQFLPFIVTTTVVVATDILAGVAAGLLVSIFFVMKSNHHAAFSMVNDGNSFLLRFNKDISFVNKTALKRHLRSVPAESSLIIDGAKAQYIDHDIYETLHDYELSATFRNISIELHHVHGKERPWRNKG